MANSRAVLRSNSSYIAQDDSFGPRLPDHYDLTLYFQHTIFHLIPALLFLLTTPFYVRQLVKSGRLVRPGWQLVAKLVVACAIAGMQLACLLLWFKSPLGSPAAKAAAVFSFLGSMAAIAMTYISHTAFLQPIIAFAIYLTVTLLIDLATVYTYFHRPELEMLMRLTCSLPPLKLALLVLEEMPKWPLIIQDTTREEIRSALSREVTAGFWNRSLFMWVNPLLFFGFYHDISNEQLPDTTTQFNSEQAYAPFKLNWHKQNQAAKYALIKAIVFSMPWPFLYVIFPRLLSVGLTCSQPFLLQDVVNFISGQATPQWWNLYKDNVKVSLILATGLVFFGKGVTKNWYAHVKNQMTIRICGTLITAIHEKSLRLPADTAEESTALTLISTDVPAIEKLMSLTYDSCAAVAEITFGITLLSKLVGPSSIFTVVLALVTTAGSRLVAKRMGTTRKRWNEHIQDRVAETSNVLAQIKDIKMAGLAPSMAMRLKEMRAKEVEVSMGNRIAVCTTFGLTALTETVTPALVVAGALYWKKGAEPISSGRFYTILALVGIATRPLASFFSSFPSWSAGFACLSRIQVYLAQEEMADPRQARPTPTTLSSSQTEGAGMRRRHGGRSAPSDPLQDTQAIALEDIDVSMDRAGSILKSANMVVKAGETTMVYGSVGCGKSTLLKLMLGEVAMKAGRAILASASVAFSGQRPWLLNTTIRLNIIGHKPFNRALYERVVFICALAPDFESMADGDETVVGTGGCLISGGQRSRICLARALFMESDVIILDDPLSALDKETSTTVRCRLFADGIATENGRALVMTTSAKEHLADANTVYRVTENGHVQLVSPEDVQAELTQLPQGKVDVADGNSAAAVSGPPSAGSSPPQASKPAPFKEIKLSGWSSSQYYFGPAGLVKVGLWVLFTVLASLSERLPYIFVRDWLGTNDLRNGYYYAGFAVLCCTYPLLNSLSAMFFYYFVSTEASNHLHTDLVDATFQATFQYLVTEDAASILNRFSGDLSMATQQIPMLLLPTLFRTASVIIDVGIISAGAKYAAPIIPFFLIAVFVIRRYYLRTSRQLRTIELECNKTLVRHFTETAAGIEHIRAFCWQDDVRREFHIALELTQRPKYFLYSIQQWLDGVLDFTATVGAVAVVSLALEYSGATSANSMGLALLSLISFTDTVSEWLQPSVRLETAYGSLERIKSYCAQTPKEKWNRDGAPVSPNWPTRGQLDMTALTPHYVSSSGEMTPMRTVTAMVYPGERLGVMGRTGSGKTTIILSILNLLQFTGTVKIDSHEIRTVNPDLLRSKITTITQSGIYLRGSVAYNLFPYDSALLPAGVVVTPQMMEDVLERVGLWALITGRGQLTSAMKDVNLSHGQRRLFSVARAILHHEVTDSKIVLMDEATEGLDEDTAGAITALVNSAFIGCTRVVVTHDESTIRGAETRLTLRGNSVTVARMAPVPDA